MIALDDCRIERLLDGGVEVIEARPQHRTFPDRVSETLGLCLKRGGDHDVRADGRRLRYPRDTVCVRTPGCVWSAAATGEVGFLSIDIEPSLLPPGGVSGPMQFTAAAALPDLAGCVDALRARAPRLHKEAVIAGVIDALARAGLVAAPELAAAAVPGAADRARDLLTSALAAPPSLRELAGAVGGNRFVLLREFRRRFGVPPHAFVVRLRVERARVALARGGDISEVAHTLGFADQSHLSRAFKRILGLSPAAYRRRAWAGS